MANTPLHPHKLIDLGLWVDYRDPIWGDSYNWSWNRATHEVEWVVYHHTVTGKDATPDDIALLHKARGWGGIGYHFVITWDGTVYYVGDVGTARANVLNKNEKVIGISMIGDFTQHNPSDAQIISAHHLGQFFLDAQAWPQLKTWDNSIRGHKELQATACPGTYWRDIPGVPDTIFERIKNNIPYSPPSTPPTPPLPPEPPDEDPCPELRNKYQQLSRDFANLHTDYENLETSNKTLSDTNAQLVIANKELKQYDLRAHSWQSLLGFAISKFRGQSIKLSEEEEA